ncbi:unnamed protein product [Symbiodinium sp. CCMP2592]|nr:unnamed protein product [Symbiodinium sp. CCMP2592]
MAADRLPPAVVLQHKGIRKARRSSQEAAKPEFTGQQDPAEAREQAQGSPGDSVTSQSLEEAEEALQLADAFPGLGRAGYWDCWKGGSKGSQEPRDSKSKGTRTIYPKDNYPKGARWKGSKDHPPFREEVPKYYFEPEEELQKTPQRIELGGGHYFENAPRVIASRAQGPSWQLRIPHYLGLNLEPHDLGLAQLARAFASALENTLQVPLVVPPLNTRSCCSCDLEPLDCRQDFQKLENPRLGSHSSFAWPKPLHMTTFFLGGSRAVLEALRCHGVEAALHIQGSSWRVRGRHLVYAEDALLTMSLHMESDGLPMDPDCVPHVTLLFKPPFTPAHANEVLRTAWHLGLTSTASTCGSNEPAVLAAPAADIAGGTRALYAWQVPATASFQACLESFWTS